LSPPTAPADEADQALAPPPEGSVEAEPDPVEGVSQPAKAEEAAEAAPVPAHIEPAPAVVAETPAPKAQKVKEAPPFQESQPVEEVKPAPVPRQPELPVITAADPDKPKRSGWWARAKANITGN
jgi:ribonuclease E